MIRLLAALALTLLLAACGQAGREPAAAPALWEVAGENGERGWLFGTIHALPDGVDWRTPAFDRAFAEADVVLVEIAELGDARQATRAFEAYARSTPQPPLSTRVDAEDRPALAALLNRAGMTENDFWDVETWAAALILSNAVRENDPSNGVDRALIAAGKPVEGLETFALQFARFDGLSDADQRALLAGLAREAEEDAADERELAWRSGDLAALEAETRQGFLARSALRKALLTERNAYYAARVAVALERKRRPFVAVGAAHMVGAEGLPALLAARGYTVRRIQ